MEGEMMDIHRRAFQAVRRTSYWCPTLWLWTDPPRVLTINGEITDKLATALAAFTLAECTLAEFVTDATLQPIDGGPLEERHAMIVYHIRAEGVTATEHPYTIGDRGEINLAEPGPLEVIDSGLGRLMKGAAVRKGEEPPMPWPLLAMCLEAHGMDWEEMPR